jgi:hypothetical protein
MGDDSRGLQRLLEPGHRNNSYFTLIFKMQIVLRIEVETTLIEVETTLIEVETILFYGQGTVLIFSIGPGGMDHR